MDFNKYEKALIYEIFIKREYKILDKYLKKGNLIFDVGGHFGFFSLYIFLLRNGFYDKYSPKNSDDAISLIQNFPYLKCDNLMIHFFEPEENFYKKSKKILKPFQENIIFNNFGISDISGEANFYINTEKTSQTSLYNNNFLNKNGVLRKANFMKLDDYINEKNISNIDLLKMDIEGKEFDIILSLNKEFFQKIKVLFFEYHILDDSFIMKFEEVKKHLYNFYENISFITSDYSNKIGYIICNN